jgi:uncharacterized protein HemY
LYDPARALKLAERATKLVATEAAYWHNLGVARYRLGDGGGAIEALKRAASLRADSSPDDLLVLALAYWKLGEKDLSRYERDLAVRLMGKTPLPNDETYRIREELEALLGWADLPGNVFAQP